MNIADLDGRIEMVSNVAELDNLLWALEDRRYKEEQKVKQNWFRGIPLPPVGQRQNLKGLMRELKKQRRAEAEARQTGSDRMMKMRELQNGPVRTSQRKADRDQRRAKAKHTAFHASDG